jgi:poly-gamma-glutamate biosynthesis protein PgsC/CapC
MGHETAFLGLVLSLGFTELTGLVPGGIIVPSYLVLFATEPQRIVGTLCAAGAALVVYRLASRRLIVFGRRRLVLMILLGGGVTVALARVAPFLIPASVEFRVIGWVIPGLIANQFERQGVVITIAALTTVTAAAHALGQLATWLLMTLH